MLKVDSIAQIDDTQEGLERVYLMLPDECFQQRLNRGQGLPRCFFIFVLILEQVVEEVIDAFRAE